MESVVKFDEKQKVFKYNGKVLSGLHPTLSDAFYPCYTYERAKLGMDLEKPSSSSSVPVVGARKKPRNVRLKRRKDEGMHIGKLVDEQIKEVHRLMRTHNLNLYHFTEPLLIPYPDELRNNVYAMQNVNGFKDTMHRYTRNLLEVLRRKGLELVTTQVPVMNNVLQVATAVDLLCVDRITNKQAVIEVKCGFMGYFDKHTRFNMSKPFEDMRDSPRSQHQLQLAFTHHMYCETFYKNPDDVNSAVIKMDANGVRIYGLDPNVTSRMKEAYEAIMEQRTKTTQQQPFKRNKIVYTFQDAKKITPREIIKMKEKEKKSNILLMKEKKEKKEEEKKKNLPPFGLLTLDREDEIRKTMEMLKHRKTITETYNKMDIPRTKDFLDRMIE